MRKMKDSGVEWIGKIPDSWNVFRNKNAFLCSKELVGEKSAETQLLSLTTKGIKLKDINNAEGKLPESFDTYQYVKENEMVMCLFDLDCSAVFSGISPYFGMISPAYRVLTCTKRMVPKYADYWFQYISHGRKFNHYAKNIRYTLSYEEFSSLPMLFPGVEEQKNIADYLDAKCFQIDSIIEKQQTIIEKLKKYKLSLYFDEFESLKIESISLGKIINHIEQGWSPSPSERQDDNGWHVLTLAAVKNGVFMANDVKPFVGNAAKCSSLVISEGDFLLTRSNTKELVGQVCIVKNPANNTIFSDLIYRLTFNDKYIIPEYAKYYFQSPQMREQISRDAHGSSSTMVKITHKDISSWLIKVPNFEQQMEIIRKLSSKTMLIDINISKREKLINELLLYKNSLIYEVVTGKKEILAS